MWRYIDEIPGVLLLAALFVSVFSSYDLDNYAGFGVISVLVWEIFASRRNKYEQRHPPRTRWQFASLVFIARLAGLCAAAAISASFIWIYHEILGGAHSWLVAPISLVFMGGLFWLRWWRNPDNSTR